MTIAWETTRVDEHRATNATEPPLSPLIAAKLNRLSQIGYELPVSELTSDELTELESLWDGGGGKYVPFSMNVPGVGTRSLVFADDLAITHRNALSRSVRVRFLDVTRPR